MRSAVVIQLVVLLWVVGVPVAEALAEPGGVCPKPAGTDFCVEDTAETPDEPATPVVDGGGRGGTGHGGGVGEFQRSVHGPGHDDRCL
jgi:hypothetical protein